MDVSVSVSDQTAAADRRVPAAPPRAVGLLTWSLPAFSALTLWATFHHQPSPSTQFADWSEFVTTRTFLVQHLVGSIVGQALFQVGAVALAVAVLARGIRTTTAIWGVVAALLGSSGLVAGFGVAAFAQPAIGQLQRDGYAGAPDLYDAVYSPLAITVLIAGGLLYATSTVLLARAARRTGLVGRGAAWLFGASGPLLSVFGVLVGELQTAGSLAGLIGGVMVARAVTARR